MIDERPWRAVVTYRFYQSRYSRPGSGTNMLMLSCRHEIGRKSSIKVPARARCHQCTYQ